MESSGVVADTNIFIDYLRAKDKKCKRQLHGILITKQLPLGIFASTQAEPWCASAIFFTIDNPSPLPFVSAS